MASYQLVMCDFACSPITPLVAGATVLIAIAVDMILAMLELLEMIKM
jgi:hypothetical protein